MEAVWGLVLTGLAVASGLAEKQQDLTVSEDKQERQYLESWPKSLRPIHQTSPTPRE